MNSRVPFVIMGKDALHSRDAPGSREDSEDGDGRQKCTCTQVQRFTF